MKVKKVIASLLLYVLSSVLLWCWIISSEDVGVSLAVDYLYMSFVAVALIVIVCYVINWCSEVLYHE